MKPYREEVSYTTIQPFQNNYFNFWLKSELIFSIYSIAAVIGTVCHWHESHNNGTLESASNHAIVRFKTDSRWSCPSCKFVIQVNASTEGMFRSY